MANNINNEPNNVTDLDEDVSLLYHTIKYEAPHTPDTVVIDDDNKETPAAPQKRRAMKLENEVANFLIEEVHNHGVIWDKGNLDHANNLLVSHAWNNIYTKMVEKFGDRMEKNDMYHVNHVKRRWVNLRDTYTRKIKADVGRSGDAASALSRWKYGAAMSFLSDRERNQQNETAMDATGDIQRDSSANNEQMEDDINNGLQIEPSNVIETQETQLDTDNNNNDEQRLLNPEDEDDEWVETQQQRDWPKATRTSSNASSSQNSSKGKRIQGKSNVKGRKRAAIENDPENPSTSSTATSQEQMSQVVKNVVGKQDHLDAYGDYLIGELRQMTQEGRNNCEISMQILVKKFRADPTFNGVERLLREDY